MSSAPLPARSDRVDDASQIDFKALFETTPSCCVVLDPELSIVAASNAFLRATRTTRQEILGRGVLEVLGDEFEGPDAAASLRASLARVLERGAPDSMPVHGRDRRTWSCSSTPVFVDNRLAYIIHRRDDVTELVERLRRAQDLREKREQDLQAAGEALHRQIAEQVRTELALRRSEGRLRQSQKLESLGRLAAGIAHDFNNMLSVVITYSDFAIHDLDESDPLREDILEVKKAGERAAALTRQLLAFSRQQMLEPRSLRLDEVVGGMEKLLVRLIGEDIELTVTCDPELGTVHADPTQIEQVLMNLVINARDAMPKGGTLRIETRCLTVGAESESHGEVPAGDYVSLTVSDTGTGMDERTQARIFEPFFTTKEVGRGTGLGLATVYGIVKQSGGHIHVQSELGKGTTFEVLLPREAESAGASAAPTPEPSRLRGTESVLLVEDDPHVRNAARSILERHGYRVLATASPGEALLASEGCGEPLHLLLTDVMMPQMSGVDLARRIAEARPGIRVLCMSGCTDEAVLQYGLKEAGLAYLQKPITPERLLAQVRQLLDAP